MKNENEIYKKRFLYVAALIIILWFASIFSSQCNAQISYCDQLSYSTYQSQGLIVTGNASPLFNMVDSIEWNWQACNSTLCYPGYGQIVTFPNILTTDTVKLCYDVYLYFMGTPYICSNCDSLVFSGGSWVLLTNTPTSINEITQEKINDTKIYDLLGRELKEVPVGTIYIRNKKLYITK
ncbi:MAG: hypothetical protein H8E55_20160 [Pelagibacterales bacterium]|nr:hypothetical protein [Pelagibacterales bacterium]